MAVALVWIKRHLKTAKPKKIGPRRRERPVLVFTDGACEEIATSVGGVIILPDDTVECFGAELNEKTISEWKTKAEQKQVRTKIQA